MSEYKLKLSFLDTFWQPLVLPPVEVIFGQKSFSPPSPGAGDAEHARRGLVGQLALLGENSRSKARRALTQRSLYSYCLPLVLDTLVGVMCTLRTAAATSIYDEAEPVRIAPLIFLLMASMNISAFPITAADAMVCLWWERKSFVHPS